jgi:hypothetical protein
MVMSASLQGLVSPRSRSIGILAGSAPRGEETEDWLRDARDSRRDSQ